MPIASSNLKDLLKMWHDVLYPVLYYVIRKDVERGRVYHAAKARFTPEFIICHPDDLEEIRTMGRPMVDLREWKPVIYR